MNTELLEIQPEEVKFIFEFQKQSSCCIRLTNRSDHHVAFKVKTTCAKKYCVRPHTGIIKPNLTCSFTVTMQAQNAVPSDFVCKDKFLIQSTIVPKGTKEEHITSTTFSKEEGKHIEEKRLQVILVSPPSSPVLSPMNEISRIRPYNASPESNDDFAQRYSCYAPVEEGIEVSKTRKSVCVVAMKKEQSLARKHTEELRLSNDVEEMKSKLRELESLLRQEKLRNNENTRTKGQIGFQFLFVVVVGLSGLYLGYMLKS
ncbi:unnamed protein product [Lactuca saligna]|uniref:MSP domain-containing protein n=1 Tax=Lactuca saligna TaxID=75948 RepID=A0AA35VNC4_LACSI|nr:unnamed protein product [Lactuca saligna]